MIMNHEILHIQYTPSFHPIQLATLTHAYNGAPHSGALHCGRCALKSTPHALRAKRTQLHPFAHMAQTTMSAIYHVHRILAPQLGKRAMWWRVSPLHSANTYTLTTLLAREDAYQLTWFARGPSPHGTRVKQRSRIEPSKEYIHF